MTLQELYSKIDGNYEQAQRVLRMDKMIDKYIRRLKDNSVGERLAAAAITMDPKEIFESAHAMKGVCANLGLEKLANLASEIAEEFRESNTRKMTDEEVKEKLNEINDLYSKTLDGIDMYVAGC